MKMWQCSVVVGSIWLPTGHEGGGAGMGSLDGAVMQTQRNCLYCFFFLIENEKAVFFFLTWKLTEEENSLGALRLSFRAGPCSLVAAAGTLADPHPALHPEV